MSRIGAASAAADQLTLMWFAGLCEGEASFLRPSPSKPTTPKIDIEMTDEDVIRRVAALLGVRYRVRDRHRQNTSITYHVRLCGKRAVQLMWSLRPYMSARRQAQIDRAMQCYVDRGEAYYPWNLPPFTFEPICREPMCARPRHHDTPVCLEHLANGLVELLKAA